MKAKFSSVAMTAAIGVSVLSGAAIAQTSSTDPQQFSRIERGRYLATVGDCVSCHTAPGGAPFAGGLALNTPFGTLLSPNITPDMQTGIGAMTDAEFTSTLRDGRGRHGKRLYPGMPYPSYTLLTDDDVAALRAYFATIPSVANDVVVNQLSFPFSLRQDMLVWNLIEFNAGRYKPDSSKSAEWNRGAYLVNGLGHCNTCHTPKSILFGDKSDADFQGAAIEGWFAPNITNSKRLGLGEWSVQEVVDYLKTGTNGRALASGSMAQVVTNSTSKMTDNDLRAMAVYLKSLEPKAEKTVAALENGVAAMKTGAAIYKDNCAACHLDSGEGLPRLFPRLAGSSNVRSEDPTTSIRKIVAGSRAVATEAAPTAPAMPSFGWRLGDQQIADVVTYIRNSWGNAAPAVTAGKVKNVRSSVAN
ncbi:MAG: cytochrome c [Proteobacteria bacterium]|nr:cytochrome c [Pseudomonadota bacterium]